MAPPRTVVIVNPRSQNGALGRRWPHVAETLRRHFPFEEARTSAPGDATRLTAAALRDGAECVVAVGGDGTINEVVNGFFDGDTAIVPNATFGIVPFGTGGDFRKTLKISKDLDKAAAVIARGRTTRIDLGRLDFTTHDGKPGTRLFANIASFGASGVVDRMVNESSKRLGGRLSFLLASAKATFTYKNQRVRLEFDGDAKSAVDMTMNTVAVANGCYFGGGMFIAPNASVDDGYFDVVALGDFSPMEVLAAGRRIYAGSHLTHEKVSHRRARTLRAEPIGGEVVELDVDGETPGILPATFTVMPRCLAVTTPDAE